jgi:hypothetical protein
MTPTINNHTEVHPPLDKLVPGVNYVDHHENVEVVVEYEHPRPDALNAGVARRTFGVSGYVCVDPRAGVYDFYAIDDNGEQHWTRTIRGVISIGRPQ